MTRKTAIAYLGPADPLADHDSLELFSRIIDALDARAFLPSEAAIWDNFAAMLRDEIGDAGPNERDA